MLESLAENCLSPGTKLKMMVVLFSVFVAVGFPDTLPRYEIEIDTAYLEAMAADPYSDEEYPALFHVDTITYECDVRYRGASSRSMPKKCYRVEFPDDENIFGVEKLNLNAGYRDKSLMRNHLAMTLFRICGLPASETRHVLLAINGEYQGVYLQVENVDEYFLERNDRTESTLYKTENHGALMAPLVYRDDYPVTFEKKYGDENDFSDLTVLFNELCYWSYEEFVDSVGSRIDLEAVLRYYAIQLAISNIDGFSKNQFLYFHPDKRLWEIFPWDMDASFGNNYNGDYVDYLDEITEFDPLLYHQFFQRCIEYDSLEQLFFDALAEVLTTGFDSLKVVVDTVYAATRDDVYRDTTKRGSDDEFDDEMDRIRDFMDERKEYLDTMVTFGRIRMSDPTLSEPTQIDGDVAVSVSIRSDSAQTISVIYSVNVDFEKRESGSTVRRLRLYDDGNHEDGEADDLIYGNTIRFADIPPPIVPYAFEGKYYTWPPNGLYYIDQIPTGTLVMTFQDSGEAACLKDTVLFGEVAAANGKHVLTLVNTSPSKVNVSCLQVVSSGYPTFHYTLPPLTWLDSGAVMALGNDSLIMAMQYPACTQRTDFNLIIPRAGDTLRLLAPGNRLLSEKVIDSLAGFEVDSFNLVINEINYNSASAFDTDDWIEFYNPFDTAVTIAGWHFHDGEDDHRFTFPESTVIDARGFLILCRDTVMFREFFPDVEAPVIGNMDFGLGGGGEPVRLYDYVDNCIDSLAYSDSDGWPLEPDGMGPTLQLLSPELDNTDPANWKASTDIGGSPGMENSVVPVSRNRGIAPDRQLRVTSDRSQRHLVITYAHTASAGHVMLRLVSLNGKVLYTIANGMLHSGTHTFRVDKGSVGTGACLLQMTIDGRQRKVMKLLNVR